MNIRNIFTGFINWVKDNKSDIKMWGGTTGVVAGTVVTCRGAVKASEIIAEYKEAKQELIDNEAEKKDIRKLQVKTAGKVALKVLPGAALEGAGLGLMWSGYSDVKAAVIGIGVAYTGLQEFVDKYRDGIKEKYGEEEDERLAYQFREEEIEIEDDDGHKRLERIKVYPHDVRMLPSPYARYFTYGEADGAEHNNTYNGHFLKCQSTVMNNNLKAHRKFMLNDCYDLLGIKRSKAGFHVGWVYDPKNPSGDNTIDLRYRQVYRERLDEFGNPNGVEKVWLIDPNVDGMVEDKMLQMGLIDE